MEEAEKKRKQEEEEAKKVREEKERAARLAAKAEEERLAAEEAAAKEDEEERLVVEAERKRLAGEAAVAEQLAVESAVAEQTRIDKEDAARLEEERLAARVPSPINEEEVAAEEPSSKRPRFEEEESNQMNQVALYAPPLEDDVDQNINIRTSSLAEPTMKLTGHKGSVYCLAYDPQGEVLCSGSFDSTCLLWKGEYLLLFNFMRQCGGHLLNLFNTNHCNANNKNQPAENVRILTYSRDTKMPSSMYALRMTLKR